MAKVCSSATKIKLTLDRFKEVTSMLQTSVGTVVCLGSEAHCRTVASASAGFLVICTRGVPGEPKKNLRSSQLYYQLYVILIVLYEPRYSSMVLQVHNSRHHTGPSRQEDGQSRRTPSGSPPW